MKRNSLILTTVIVILATFAWAGWANWVYRRHIAEQQAAEANARAKLLNGTGGTGAEGSGNIPQVNIPLVGKPAPNFTLNDLSGNKVSLASYRGKAVLINFWATWCTPCRIETPWLVQLHNQYAPQGFEVLGVSAEGDDASPTNDVSQWKKDKAAIEQFAGKHNIPYPILLNGDSIVKPYGGVDMLPTSFFVNRKGIVVATETGLTSKGQIAANIRKALGK